MKEEDVVYHRRTGKGPFTVYAVGGEKFSTARMLDSGWFIHSGNPRGKDLIDDYVLGEK